MHLFLPFFKNFFKNLDSQITVNQPGLDPQQSLQFGRCDQNLGNFGYVCQTKVTACSEPTQTETNPVVLTPPPAEPFENAASRIKFFTLLLLLIKF